MVIVNVVGTDFAPYRRLLGSDGLDVPSAVLTDGDPLRNSVTSAEQGLKRAARLLHDAVRRQKVTSGAARLIELAEEGTPTEVAELRSELQDICALEDVYVGDDTLELDLLPLLGDELVEAFAELAAKKKSANLARDIVAILAADELDEALSSVTMDFAETADMEPRARSGDLHRRARVLGRIEELGKGRIAQRWAGHIEEIDLRAGLINLLDVSGLEVSADVADGTEPVTGELLGQAGSVRACLRVLEWASQQARGGPFLVAVSALDED